MTCPKCRAEQEKGPGCTPYGKEISLQLHGTLETYAGHLRLRPVGGKLGSLPIRESILNRVFRRLFETPEKRENISSPTRGRVGSGREHYSRSSRK